jgi:hypothetical protein
VVDPVVNPVVDPVVDPVVNPVVDPVVDCGQGADDIKPPGGLLVWLP